MPNPLSSRPRPAPRRGQSSTEYLLVIAVLVLSLLVSAWLFMPGFESGVQGLEADMEKLLQNAQQDGSGNQR